MVCPEIVKVEIREPRQILFRSGTDGLIAPQRLRLIYTTRLFLGKAPARHYLRLLLVAKSRSFTSANTFLFFT